MMKARRTREMPFAVAMGLALVMLALGFLAAMGVRSLVVETASAEPDPPNPGHSWSEIGDLPGTMWHSNNDGDGSGLDADMVDGMHAGQTGTDYIPYADASGRVGIGTTDPGVYGLSVSGKDRGILGMATGPGTATRPWGVVAGIQSDASTNTGGGFYTSIDTSNTPNIPYVFGLDVVIDDAANKQVRGIEVILAGEDAGTRDCGIELQVDDPGYALYSYGSGKSYFGGKVGVGTTNPGADLQVTGGDVAVTTQGNGIILRATDGPKCYRVTVNNLGLTSTAEVSCPSE